MVYGEGKHTDENVLRELYHSDGLTMREIANRLGVSIGAVQYWMDKHGLEREGGCAGYSYAPYTVNDGYPRWNAPKSEGVTYASVHRLLAVAEFGFDEVVGNVVHHKNGVKWDNRPCNLKVMDKHDHMSYHWREENNPSSKLDAETASEIQEMYSDTEKTQSEIAGEYGLHQSTVSRVVNGKRWQSIK